MILCNSQDDELENAKAEMGEVREENERLKMMLQHIEMDYQSLQLRFFDILKREASKKPTEEDHSTPDPDLIVEETEEPELVSLCLGRRSSPKGHDQCTLMKKANNDSNSSSQNVPVDHGNDHCLDKANLTLGISTEELLVSDPSTENSAEDVKEAEASNKTSSKTTRHNGDDEISQQAQTKRARVSVRARCDAPTVSTVLLSNLNTIVRITCI